MMTTYQPRANQANIYNNRRTTYRPLKKPAFKRSRAYGKRPSGGTVAVPRYLSFRPEVKRAFNSSLHSTVAFVNAAANVVGWIYPFFPTIALGSTNSTRNGNKINVVSNKMRLNLMTEQNAVAFPPVNCRVMVGCKKVYPANTPQNNFFDIWDGGSVSLPFQQTQLDNILTPNTDSWKILYDKTYKLGPASFSGLNQVNNDYKTFEDFEIDISPFCKTLGYSDNVTDPITGAYWVWIIPTYSSDQTVSSFSSSHVKGSFENKVLYTDY